MNTRDLDYFIKLVDVKNFSAVAEYFGVSQPTISIAVKRLETLYGVELLKRDRSHNLITITPAGQQLYLHASIIANELTQTAQDLSALQTTTIRLGLPPIIGNYYFPRMVERLFRHHLMSNLQTVEAGSNTLLEQLKSGEIDIGLLGSVGPLVDPELTVTELTSAPFNIVANRKKRLDTNGKVGFADLVGESFITLSSGFMHTQAFSALSRTANVRQRVVFRTGDVQLIKNMVQQNIGIALLTSFAIAPEDNLQVLRLTDVDQPQFTISVAHRKTQVLPPMMRKLEFILTHAEN